MKGTSPFNQIIAYLVVWLDKESPVCGYVYLQFGKYFENYIVYLFLAKVYYQLQN